jgi:hypothetical protein
MFNIKKEEKHESGLERKAEKHMKGSEKIEHMAHFDGHGHETGINITGKNPIYDHSTVLKKKMKRY